MEKKSHFLQKIFDHKKIIFYKKAKNITSIFKLIIYIFHYFTNKNTCVYKYL